MATKTPPDFDFLSEVTWDDLDENGVSVESENGLCVPQDNLYEIELFPAFGSDLISLSGILLSPQRESTWVDHRVNTNKPSFSNNHYAQQESEDKGQRVLHDKKQDPIIISKKRRSYRRRGCSTSWSSNERKLRCTHCQAEKTPLWRLGPLGPKTLCNACGVRYKSGRLMPEYRPAASPNFDSRKHSNFHRNILRKLNQ